MEFVFGLIVGVSGAFLFFSIGWVNGFSTKVLAQNRHHDESLEQYAQRLSRG